MKGDDKYLPQGYDLLGDARKSGVSGRVVHVKLNQEEKLCPWRLTRDGENLLNSAHLGNIQPPRQEAAVHTEVIAVLLPFAAPLTQRRVILIHEPLASRKTQLHHQ